MGQHADRHRTYIVRLFVAGMLVLSSFAAFPQRQIDSLEAIVKSSQGKQKVDALNKLSFQLLNYSNESFTQSSEQALKMSERLGYEKGKAEALILLGISEYTIGNKITSNNYIRQGIAISTKIKDNGLRGYGFTQLGINHQYEDRLDSAMYCFRVSYEALKDSLNPYYLSRAYLGMADCYGMTSEYDLQLKYLKKCLTIRELLKDQSVNWLLTKLSGYYTDRRDFDRAISCLDIAQKTLRADTVDNETISEIQAQRAMVQFKKGNFSEALRLFYAARQYYEKNSRQQELTNLLLNIGLVFDSMDNYDLSLKSYFEALSIAEAHRYQFEMIKLQYAIGWSYFRLGQIQLASNYVNKSLKAAEVNLHPTDAANALNLLGMLAGAENKNDEALDYLNRALKMRQSFQDNLRQATTTFYIGTIYEKLNKLDTSLTYQLRALAIREASKDQEAIANSYQVLGRLYTKLHNYHNAGIYLDRAEVLAKKIKISYVLLNVYEARRDLLKIEFQFEKALQYSRLYENLRDSIFTNHLSSSLSILENIYHLQEKEQEIKLLSQQKKIQESNLSMQSAQIRQQRTIIIFTIGTIVLLVIVSFIIFRYYRKVTSLNQEITEQNEEIQSQSEELSESNTMLVQLNDEILQQKQEILTQAGELAKRNEIISLSNQGLEEKIQVRTSELKQAYKELDTFFYRSSHDFRRPLTTFMGLAEVAKITVKDPMALELFEKVNETARSLDKMLFKLQSISDVGTQELIYKEVYMADIFDLELDHFKNEIQKSQIQIHRSVRLKKSFQSYPVLIQIIIRNLLENAIAFAAKSHAVTSISTYESGDQIVIEVQDNGEGIPPEYIDRVWDMYFRASDRSKGNGLGLYIVRKTVEKLNGRLEMVSKVDQGTTIKVLLPNQLK